MASRIQLRRDTAANWASVNPILSAGEPGYETDTGKIKYGNGSTAWNSLPYLTDGLATETFVNNTIENLIDGAPNLLDTLNEIAAAVGDDPAFFSNIATSVSNEANARIAADTSLQGNISTEANARIAADTSLQGNISTEANARIAADNTLQSNIDAEANARIAADNLKFNTADFNNTANTWIGLKTTSDLAEGTNQYFTNARARSALSVTDSGGDGSLSYNDSTGVFTYTGPSATEVRAHLSAGTGIIYSSGEFSVNTAVIATTNSLHPVATSGNYSALNNTPTAVSAFTNDANYANVSYVDTSVSNAITNLVDGAPNLLNTLNELSAAINDDPAFFSNIGTAVGNEESARIAADLALQGNINAEANARIATDNLKFNTADFNNTANTWIGLKTTSDLAEGTNQYFTNARARSALSVTDSGGDGSLSYNDSTGVFTYTGPSATEVRAHLSAGTGLDYSNGQFSVNASVIASQSNLTSGLALKANIADLDNVATSGAYADLSGTPNFGSFGESIVPTTDRTIALGGWNKRWANIHVDKVNFGQHNHSLAAPAINGVNDKITLWDFNGAGSGFNYAIGAEGSHMWFSMDVNNGSGGFKFYSRDNQIFKIRDDGALLFDDSSIQTTAWTGSVPWGNVTSKPNFANVATSGAYSDLSGTPTAVSSFTNDANYANVTYVDNKVSDLVNSAPSTLDTLKEIADALGNDPNLATTLTNSIGTKLATADFNNTANTWIGLKTTSDLTEGTNQYFTVTRARDSVTAGTGLNYSSGQFSVNTSIIATQSDLSSGLANKLNTSDFNNTADSWIALRSTSNIAEGTNQYFTNARARSALSVTDSGGDGSLSYNDSTGVFTYTGPSATEVRAHLSAGTGLDYSSGQFSVNTAVIATQSNLSSGLNLKANIADLANVATSGAYADLSGKPTAVSSFTNDSNYANVTYVDNKVSDLVNSAPTTLDTLKEIADALGNDPNLATTLTNSIGTKLATADFNSTANTWIGLKTTSDLAEGSNQYFTTQRARDSVTAGTGLDYTSGQFSVNTSVIATQSDLSSGLALKANISSLAAVATSGNYSDLNNKPLLVSSLSIVGANLNVTKTDNSTTDIGSVLGYTGSQGIQGDTGYVGSQGIQGDTGYVGSQGIQGDTGYVGSQGIQGDVGATGPIGFTGSQGIQGDVGATGPVGFVGSKGDTGLGFNIAKIYANVSALTGDVTPTGIVAGEFALINTGNVEDADNGKLYLWNGSAYTYVTDLSGSAGIQGPSGAAGSQGDTGYTGSQGVQGDVGATGPIGFTGSQGDVGYVGSQGVQGDVGATGLIGFTGSQGIEGPTGPSGLEGPTGPSGLEGPTGPSGPTGLQGDTGYTGSQGLQGDPGTPGITGDVGATGPIGFTGSQGEVGYTGSQGVQGDVGATGPIGFTGSQGDVGYVGSQGVQGDVGATGPIGFTGSQGDVGYTGSQGVQGDVGATGPIGFTGSQGDVGYVGSQGVQGDVGATGPIGFTGSQGDVGYTGSQGVQGDVGATGPIGFTGSQGDVGYVGSQGVQGDVGATGPVGYTGSQGEVGYTGSQGPVGATGPIGTAETIYDAGNITGTVTFDYDNGTVQTANLTGNITINSISNISTGESITLILKQDGTGDRLLTVGANLKFAAGFKTLSTAGSSIDLISMFYDGSTYYCTLTTGYA